MATSTSGANRKYKPGHNLPKVNIPEKSHGQFVAPSQPRLQSAKPPPQAHNSPPRDGGQVQNKSYGEEDGDIYENIIKPPFMIPNQLNEEPRTVTGASTNVVKGKDEAPDRPPRDSSQVRNRSYDEEDYKHERNTKPSLKILNQLREEPRTTTGASTNVVKGKGEAPDRPPRDSSQVRNKTYDEEDYKHERKTKPTLKSSHQLREEPRSKKAAASTSGARRKVKPGKNLPKENIPPKKGHGKFAPASQPRLKPTKAQAPDRPPRDSSQVRKKTYDKEDDTHERNVKQPPKMSYDGIFRESDEIPFLSIFSLINRCIYFTASCTVYSLLSGLFGPIISLVVGIVVGLSNFCTVWIMNPLAKVICNCFRPCFRRNTKVRDPERGQEIRGRDGNQDQDEDEDPDE